MTTSICRLVLLSFVGSSFLTGDVESLEDPAVPHIFFPFGTDEGDSVVPVGDDVSSPPITIPTGFPYLYGNSHTAFVSIKFLNTVLF